MTRIYLSGVGEQDPISETTNSEGSILTSFGHLCEDKQLQFQLVFLLPSSRETSPNRHTEDHAAWCVEALQEAFGIKPQILPLKVRNAADIRQVYPEMRRVLEEEIMPQVRDLGKGKIEFHINASSGTPQMKGAWPLLVNRGVFEPYPVEIWQVMDPRGGGTRQERVRPGGELDLLVQESTLNQAKGFAQRNLYGAIAGELEILSGDFAQFCFKLCQVLESYDHGEYKTAAAHHIDLWRESQAIINRLPDEWRGILSNQKQKLAVLANPKSEDFESCLVLAIYHAAEHRFKAGIYGNVLTVAHTACEVAVDYRLKQLQEERPGFQLSLDDLDYAAKRNHLSKYDESFRDLEQERIQHQSLGYDCTVGKAMDWHRYKRNDVEHKGDSVNEAMARDALNVSRKFIKHCLKCNDQEINDFPFNPRKVEGQLVFLIGELRNQLWRI
jgi:hypothetical protein